MTEGRKEFPIAVHPGEVLNEMLAESGTNQTQLARHLKMDPSKINEICNMKRGISAVMAVQLGKAFRVQPTVWLNLQMNWELSQADADVAEGTKPFRCRKQK